MYKSGQERIGLNDSLMDIIIKLSERNPGALGVCMDIYKKGGEIDPDDFMEGYGGLLALDTHGIYGPRIWMLFKDVCGGNLIATMAALRAVQLGFASDVALNYAIDNYGKGFDIKDLYAKVKAQLPKFAELPETKP